MAETTNTAVAEKPKLSLVEEFVAGAKKGFYIGAEMIAAAAGLGWLILDGEEMARPDVVLAGIFVLGLLGILTDAAVRALGRRCWRFTGGE